MRADLFIDLGLLQHPSRILPVALSGVRERPYEVHASFTIAPSLFQIFPDFEEHPGLPR